MKHKEKVILRTWKPITLGIVFLLLGLVNLFYILLINSTGLAFISYEVDMILTLVFGFLLIYTSWGFFKKRMWSIKLGFIISLLILLTSLLLLNLLSIIIWVFVLYLVCSYMVEMAGKKESPKLKYFFIVGGFILLIITIILSGESNSNNSFMKISKYDNSIIADDFVSEFLSNPIAAKQRYIGDEVFINGQVNYISDIDFGVPTVSLGSVIYQSVMCILEDETQVYYLSTGDHIDVRGTVIDTYAENVVLDKCVVLS